MGEYKNNLTLAVHVKETSVSLFSHKKVAGGEGLFTQCLQRFSEGGGNKWNFGKKKVASEVVIGYYLYMITKPRVSIKKYMTLKAQSLRLYSWCYHAMRVRVFFVRSV